MAETGRSGERESGEHKHDWQPNGTVKVDRVAASPCSTLDDHLWTDILSVQVCSCGSVRRVKGDKNLRRRGDDYRRARGQAPLGRPLR